MYSYQNNDNKSCKYLHKIMEFSLLFKRYRLRSEIATLSEFGDLLSAYGIVYENSIFTRWQRGDRVPKERHVLLKIVYVFIQKGGITCASEVNTFLESAGQGYLTDREQKLVSFSSRSSQLY